MRRLRWLCRRTAEPQHPALFWWLTRPGHSAFERRVIAKRENQDEGQKRQDRHRQQTGAEPPVVSFR